MFGQVFSRTLAVLSFLSAAVMSSPVLAYEAGDWIIRGRVILVQPTETSSTIRVDNVSVPGSGVTVDDDIQPEIDITYMFTKHWGAELILGQSQHDVSGKGSLVGLGPIIDLHLLPPTLTLQYHFLPDNNIRPYVGMGVSYVHPFEEKVTGGLAAPGARVKVEDSLGFALQAGVDIDVYKDWFVNFDIKYIDLETTGNFRRTAVGNVRNTVDVSVDPLVYGIGIGTRF